MNNYGMTVLMIQMMKMMVMMMLMPTCTDLLQLITMSLHYINN